jgi:predicted DNA-binding ribbon-helix-helix protein
MANLSVRGVGEKSLQRLKQTAKRRGVSVNRLITDILNSETGLAPATRKIDLYSDLDKLAGTWSAAEARAFDQAVASFGQVDEELWR